MKVISREFSLKEKILLLLLSLVLVGLAYYQFVDRPVRATVTSAHRETQELKTELKTVEAKLEKMRRMRSEIEDVTAGGTASEMYSYNNSKAEIALLNDILGDTLQYAITFENVTREGDQIRRDFSLQFTVDKYDAVEGVLQALNGSPYRCLIGDVRCSANRDGNIMDGNVTVNAVATFYETMVGGTPDAGLPETRPSAR